MVRRNYVRSMQAEMRDRLQSNYICTYVRLGPSLDKGLSLRRRNATIMQQLQSKARIYLGTDDGGDEASAKAQAGQVPGYQIASQTSTQFCHRET